LYNDNDNWPQNKARGGVATLGQFVICGMLMCVSVGEKNHLKYLLKYFKSFLIFEPKPNYFFVETT